MVVGCIVEHEGKILLCKRGIEPCKGLWSVPAGLFSLPNHRWCLSGFINIYVYIYIYSCVRRVDFVIIERLKKVP